ncbi:MAG: GIY-YIG nuclease family protein [Ignavibacteriales bacterium]|nr:GIY-YIG nuclease family protein [Ignavibacteriales bacterium]
MQKENLFTVYVLQSVVDGKRYIGLTKNIQTRLSQHNLRKVRSTKSRAPFVLKYQEQHKTLSEARLREKYFKTAAGRRWLENVAKV